MKKTEEKAQYKVLPTIRRMLRIMKEEKPVQIPRIIILTITLGLYPFMEILLPKIAIGTIEKYGDRAVNPLVKNMIIFFLIAGSLALISGVVQQVTNSTNIRIRLRYLGKMSRKMQTMEYKYVEDSSFQEDVEMSLRKRFRKKIWCKFAKAINEYDLVQEGDCIAVCISGGKDSMLMAKLFQELKRHNKFPFELVFLVMDPGYSEANRKIIENNAKLMDIPITIFESQIFDAVYDIEDSPCYLCARMRRGYLYSHAKELGCNKIALGHHYDDVIETILMGMLYGGQVQTMMPKLHSTNFEGMELIRPMYLIREDDIKHWRDYNDLHFIQCACRFTDTCTTCRTDGSSPSKRMEIKNLIASLKQTNPFIEGNIFKSVENVNLRTIIAYKEDGVKHHFLEHYDEWK